MISLLIIFVVCNFPFKKIVYSIRMQKIGHFLTENDRLLQWIDALGNGWIIL